MSTINTLSFRETFERTAALALLLATVAIVAGGAIAMCAQ